MNSLCNRVTHSAQNKIYIVAEAKTAATAEAAAAAVTAATVSAAAEAKAAAATAAAADSINQFISGSAAR